MVDAHHGDAPAQRQRLGRGDADQQRADQARPGRDGDGGQVASGDAGLVQGAFDDRRDRLDVGAAGQLGDDPAERGVQVDLAGDDRRAHRVVVVDDGRRRLVARRLDGQQDPAHGVSGQRAVDLGPRDRPLALHRRSAPADVDQRRGHVVELPAVDDQVDGGAEAGRHVVRRARRGRAVGVGAGHDEHAGLLEERRAGSRGRGCAPPPRRARPASRPRQRRPRSRRPGSAAPATSAGPAPRRRR